MDNEKKEPELANILYNILSEYLDCAVLVGYNDKGERISINHFQNTLERDALESLLSHKLKEFDPQEIRIIEEQPPDDYDQEDYAIR